MVSLAVSTCSNTTLPSQTSATAEWSSWVRPRSAESWARADATSAGLANRVLPSAKV